MLTTTTITILRNEDKNYDRLFREIESSAILGRVASLNERKTATGYAVTFAYLGQDVLGWIADRPRDFAIEA